MRTQPASMSSSVNAAMSSRCGWLTTASAEPTRTGLDCAASRTGWRPAPAGSGWTVHPERARSCAWRSTWSADLDPGIHGVVVAGRGAAQVMVEGQRAAVDLPGRAVGLAGETVAGFLECGRQLTSREPGQPVGP